MKYMTPVWLRYPEVEPDSIEWRMGLGEAYIARWIAWKKQRFARRGWRYGRQAGFLPLLFISGEAIGWKACARISRLLENVVKTAYHMI